MTEIDENEHEFYNGIHIVQIRMLVEFYMTVTGRENDYNRCEPGRLGEILGDIRGELRNLQSRMA